MNNKKIVVAGMDQKELAVLANRIAGDMHLREPEAIYEIGQAILEYQNEIDLSDYNATVEFIRKLFEPFDV